MIFTNKLCNEITSSTDIHSTGCKRFIIACDFKSSSALFFSHIIAIYLRLSTTQPNQSDQIEYKSVASRLMVIIWFDRMITHRQQTQSIRYALQILLQTTLYEQLTTSTLSARSKGKLRLTRYTHNTQTSEKKKWYIYFNCISGCCENATAVSSIFICKHTSRTERLRTV